MAADPEAQAGLRRTWKALMAIGIVAIVIGCVAIIYPAAASVGTAIFIGWILMIIGVFLVAAAFSATTIGSVAAAAGLGLPDRSSSGSGSCSSPTTAP